MTKTPVEELDGCEEDFTEDPTSDDDITAVVLFASADEENVETLVAEWGELFNGS